MNLATQILKFFYLDINKEKSSLKTVEDFASSQPGWSSSLNVNEILRICSVFEHHGLLMQGTVLGHPIHPILGKSFCAINFEERRADYGEYEFVAHGLSKLREQLMDSVHPVVVTKKDGTEDIGTCFLAGNSHSLVTARHVVENMERIEILGNDKKPIRVINISIPENSNLDIAILLVDDQAFKGTQALRFDNHKILDEVLCIGYPPIPGFDAIQVSDITNINSIVKSSRGRIVSNSTSYLDQLEYILLNARIKGGNSGGPIINSRGYVVGILVQTSFADGETSKLDELGYGIAVPYESFNQLLEGENNPNPPIIEMPFKNLDGGGFKTIIA